MAALPQLKDAALALDERVALLTFKRDDVRNALTSTDLTSDIVTTLAWANTSPDVSVLIITGDGSAFSAGGNIKTMGERAKAEDLFPDRNGYSFGRWEGDKLIVETSHLKEAVDQARYPHSENAKIVEEYTLVANDDGTKVLTSKMTMTDPEFYTQPITAEKKWQLQPGVRLLPYECNEPAWEEHLERLRQGQSEG